jgi:DNA-binding response OmpR family regulator
MLLMIGNDPVLAEDFRHRFAEEGYAIHSEAEGQAGLVAARRLAPDALLLETAFPGTLDGLEICRIIRQDRTLCTLPILFLTASSGESDQVRAFESGADDYVLKPARDRELLARLGAVFRRSELDASVKDVVRVGRIVMSTEQRSVTIEGRSIFLTSTEFDLLRVLAERSGEVVSRKELIRRTRGMSATSQERTVDVHMTAIRKKLGAPGAMIEAVPGQGYRLSRD